MTNLKHYFIISFLCLWGIATAQETYLYPSERDKPSTKDAHLFILSGQSNMTGLRPEVSFTREITNQFGRESVIIVKDAKGAQSIQRWYKDWKSVEGVPSKFKGDLYDRLLTNVNNAIKGRKIKTITFVWMQGEQDAAVNQVGVYKASLEGLMTQLENDLGRKDINLVIGRLSDYSLASGKHPQWQDMRDLQQAFAEENPRAAWVNTDDLNNRLDPKTDQPFDDVHYTASGYVILGQRFAQKSIQLIHKHSKDLGAIWCIGDEMMLGNAESTPRAALYKALKASGYTFSFTGHQNSSSQGLPQDDESYQFHSAVSGKYIGGSSKRGVLEDLGAIWNQGRLKDHKPQTIFITLGSNDIGNGHDLNTAPERLKKLIEKIYTLRFVGNPTILVSSIPPNKSDEAHRTNVMLYNTAISSMVNELRSKGKNIGFVDQYTVLEDKFKKTMQKDMIHPTALGNEKMAQQWVQGVTDYKKSIDISTSVEKAVSLYPGSKSKFKGFDVYEFRLKGRVGVKIVAPEKPAKGKPWLWRSLFWEAIHRFNEADLQLVKEGYHVVIVHGDVAGHPSGNYNIDVAYDYLTKNYGFSKKCSMASMSRGNLSLFRWANANPYKVESIYVDNGVCNLRSWPAGNRVPGNENVTTNGDPASWGYFKMKFKYATDEEALNSKQSPIDLLEPLAKAGVPILTVCGSGDNAVPYEENDAILEERYKKLGGDIKVIIENKGHSHGMVDPTPVLEFIRKHTNK